MNSFRRIPYRRFATATKPKSNALPLFLIGSIFALGPGYYLFTKPSPVKPQPKPESKPVEPKVAQKIQKQDVKRIPGVPFVQYVLIGGGTAAYSALEAIRESEPNAQVLVISEEEFVPYQRPPLSKEMWFEPKKDLKYIDWQGKETSLFYLDKNSFQFVKRDQLLDDLSAPSSKPYFLPSTRVEEIDPELQVLFFVKGAIQYGKVLIATGGKPKTLDFMKNGSDKITTFRGINDFKALEKISGKTVAVIGGGFLGSELSNALAHKAKAKGGKVIQIFPEDGNLSLVLPNYLTKWTTSKLIEQGVDVKPNTNVSQVTEQEGKLQIHVKESEEVIEADHVVVAVGLKPNTDIALHSDLEIDPVRDGILVNAELEARTNVFVAGDVSSYHDIALGRRRVEHYDHAAVSGRTAGLNMTGAKKPYTHQSMFWSSIGPNISFEAIGVLDSKLPTVSIWSRTPDSEKEYNRGVVYYMKEDIVTGVLLWNLHGQVVYFD
jgi:programmed cell death 8 (apoptosis-inducing factor)